MITPNDVANLVLSAPGMEEPVKLDLKLTRKHVLLLHYLIENGMTKGEKDDGIAAFLQQLPEQELSSIATLSDNMLQKAGLMDLKEKMKMLTVKK